MLLNEFRGKVQLALLNVRLLRKLIVLCDKLCMLPCISSKDFGMQTKVIKHGKLFLYFKYVKFLC